MHQIADEILEYAGFHAFPSKCRLRAFAEAGGPTVVIATELPDNPGTSVTNAALLAAQVYQWLERPEGGMVLIEHYEKDGEEEYAQNAGQTVQGLYPASYAVTGWYSQGERTDAPWTCCGKAL